MLKTESTRENSTTTTDKDNFENNKSSTVLTKSVDLPDTNSFWKLENAHKKSESYGSIDLNERSKTPSPSISFYNASSPPNSTNTNSSPSRSPFHAQKPTKLNLKSQALPPHRPFDNMPHVLTSPSDINEDKTDFSSNENSQNKNLKKTFIPSPSQTHSSPILMKSPKYSANMVKAHEHLFPESPIKFPDANAINNFSHRFHPSFQRDPMMMHRFPIHPSHLPVFEPRIISYRDGQRQEFLQPIRRPRPPFFPRPILRHRPLRFPTDPTKMIPRSNMPNLRRFPPYHQTPQHHQQRHQELIDSSLHTNSLPRSFKQENVPPSPLLQERFQNQFQQKQSEEQSDSDEDDGDWC